MSYTLKPACFIWLLLFIILAVLAPSTTQPIQAISTSVVISQVYGGGKNSGAYYTHDFIELFNRGSSPVSLNGWTLQYAVTSPFNANEPTTTTTLPDVTLQPGQYYLIQEGTGSDGNVTQPLPSPDFTDPTPISMGANRGRVVLANNGTSVVDVASANVVDFVGYGAITDPTQYEGSGPTAAPNNTQSIHRNGNGCTDTDDNAGNFSLSSVPPTPRNSQTPFTLCPGVNTATPTHTPETPTLTPTPVTPTATDTPQPPSETPVIPTSTPETPTVTPETPTLTPEPLTETPEPTLTEPADETPTPTAQDITNTPDISTHTPTTSAVTPTPNSSTITPTSDANTPTVTPEENTPTATQTQITPTATPLLQAELLVNGGMEVEIDGDKIPDNWQVKNGSKERQKCNKEDKVIAHSGECAFQFKGSGALEKSKLVQSVDFSGISFSTGDTLTLSVIVNAPNSAAKGKIKLRVKYSDDTAKGKSTQAFGHTPQYMQFVREITLESINIAEIAVQIDHRSPAGKVFVDDASLIWSRSTGLLPLP
jgi:hypothetical protein